MADKIDLPDIGSLANSSSARAAINSNFNTIENAIDNTLSRDGSTPNQMEADIDLNGNSLLNVADPVNDMDGVNKRSVGDLVEGFVSEIAETIIEGTARVDRFIATAGQSDFTLTDSPGMEENMYVFDNGIAMTPNLDFHLTGADLKTLTFFSPRTLDAEIVCRYVQLAPTEGLLRADLGNTAATKGGSLVAFTASGTGAVERDVTEKLREVEVSICDFGADPTGVTACDSAWAAAQAALPLTGGTIVFPAGTFLFTTTMVIGNAPATLPSTLNGVKVRGAGTGKTSVTMNANAGATVLKWGGAAGGTLMRIQGPISGVQITDLFLDGNSLAATLIESQRSFHQTIKRIIGVAWTNGYALVLNANSALAGYGGAAPISHVYEQVDFQNPGVGANSVDISSGNGNINQVLFERCYFDRYNTTSTVGLRLGYCDHIQFVGCHIAQTGASGSSGIAVSVRPQPGLGNFPSNITFTGTAMAGGVQHDSTLEAWSSANVFPALIYQPFYTADGAPVPPASANAGPTLPGFLARGVTDNGIEFGWSAETQETIVSAATISPVKKVVILSGSTPVSTITPPRAAFSVPVGGYRITIIPSGNQSLITGGNIAEAATLLNYRAVELVYSEGTGYWHQVGLSQVGNSGTYTPTLTNITNLSASTARECTWLRVGNTVHVTGRVEATATAAADASTVIELTLPITPASFAQTWECAGTATISEAVYRPGIVIAQGTSARILWQAASTSSRGVVFTFSYQMV